MAVIVMTIDRPKTVYKITWTNNSSLTEVFAGAIEVGMIADVPSAVTAVVDKTVICKIERQWLSVILPFNDRAHMTRR